MLLVVRLALFLIALMISNAAFSKDLYILVIGQSISSNCNEYMYGEHNNIFQIGLDGEVKNAKDPFEWADCKGGSMWMPLGEIIINSGIANRVIYMPLGIGGTKAIDWLDGGVAHLKLRKAIELIKKNNFDFEYGFWHQGSSDIGLNSNLYMKQVLSVIGYIKKEIKVNKWIIAQHSKCFGRSDDEIAKAQIILGSKILNRFFKGPDTNALSDTLRFDGCHLNKIGQEEMAKQWFDSMKKSENIEKETLLFYFQKRKL